MHSSSLFFVNVMNVIHGDYWKGAFTENRGAYRINGDTQWRALIRKAVA